MGSLDLKASIPSIFGSVQLAPFHSLQGTYCRTGVHPPDTQIFNAAGFTETGAQVQASATAMYRTSSPGNPAMSVAPALVTIPISGSSGSSSVSLHFGSGSPAWTVSTLPSSEATSWLTVSPTSGGGSTTVTLTAKPGPLGKGVYTATLVIEATDASPQFIDVPVTMLVGNTSQIKIGGVANAATNGQAFAPGMLLSVYGAQLAPAGTAQLAGTLPLPLNLMGVTATVNGLTAPLYYLSPGQLNIQVPYETSAGTAILGVNNNGQVTSFPFQVTAAAPGIFTASTGALVPYASGAGGATLLAFVTGAGDLNPIIPTGQTPIAQLPLADLPQTLLPLTVTVGSQPATVKFAGATYGLVGVVQINFVVPANLPAGPQNVVVTVGGVASPPATITVTQ